MATRATTKSARASAAAPATDQPGVAASNAESLTPAEVGSAAETVSSVNAASLRLKRGLKLALPAGLKEYPAGAELAAGEVSAQTAAWLRKSGVAEEITVTGEPQ